MADDRKRWVESAYPAYWSGFTPLPNTILLDADLSANAVRVYVLLTNLYRRRGERDEPDPPVDVACDLIGMTRRAWGNATTELVKAGLLEVRRRGQGMTNAYRVLPPESANQESAQSPVLDGAQSSGARAGASSSLSEEGKSKSTTSAELALRPVPKLIKLDGRNVGFDALAQVCGVDPNGNRAREVATALNGAKGRLGIRALCWQSWNTLNVSAEKPEAFERWVVSQIEHKSRLYKASMSGAMLTPLALAKWWTDLDKIEPRTGRVSADDIMRAAHEET